MPSAVASLMVVAPVTVKWLPVPPTLPRSTAMPAPLEVIEFELDVERAAPGRSSTSIAWPRLLPTPMPTLEIVSVPTVPPPSSMPTAVALFMPTSRPLIVLFWASWMPWLPAPVTTMTGVSPAAPVATRMLPRTEWLTTGSRPARPASGC